MTLDHLPELVTLEFLEEHGLTREDVHCRCPLAVEYGPKHDPYWHRDDLAALLTEGDGGDAP